jgi:hypothetical protein
VVRHATAEPQPRGEDLRRSYVGLRQIDHSDVTTELDRQRPRRPAQAAADVQHLHPRLQSSEAGKSHGRCLTAAVKLIQWRQHIDGQRLEVLARGGKDIEDRLLQAVSTPVVIDRLHIACLTHGHLRTRAENHRQQLKPRFERASTPLLAPGASVRTAWAMLNGRRRECTGGCERCQRSEMVCATPSPRAHLSHSMEEITATSRPQADAHR